MESEIWRICQIKIKIGTESRMCPQKLYLFHLKIKNIRKIRINPPISLIETLDFLLNITRMRSQH